MARSFRDYTDDDELDRPDLNKCPDCDCFFADDNCPLCGLPCPEDMKAGNRKPVKKKKRRKRGGEQYRVTFIPWYHSWWFILLMMFFSPFSIVGIVLLITSPHRRGVKQLCIALMLIYAFLSTFGIPLLAGALGLSQTLSNLWTEPVDRSLSQEEYVAACEEVAPEEFYRNPHDYDEKFVTMQLLVVDRIVDQEAYYTGDEFTTYYVCTDGNMTFLIRDCADGTRKNYVAGDLLRIYGEGAGEHALYDMYGNPYDAPRIHAAFLTLVG